MANKVARECQGLPIALVTVGRALREDYDIPIEDLTRYAVGYGLHQDVVSIEDARKQVYVAIKTLKDCCMLLGTETEKEVKMHDLVRDVAIQIASSKEHGFMVKPCVDINLNYFNIPFSNVDSILQTIKCQSQAHHLFIEFLNKIVEAEHVTELFYYRSCEEF
ncbi:RESISTANCE PROTEIN RGA2 putative-RELATED [Salix purpurea]|uniref:RESISTANCE PROTEIN RGA2 putative-RELATED n=1 Tax=Salix purpurea TaxID=77065 RepID=A0A9Q0VRN6_SALPP|nr:RESISTANCE PROTEIN RGA2 putative-RELATED [Salix purpurea]